MSNLVRSGLQKALRNAVKYSGVRPVRLLVYDAEMS
jgi:hypothetical protein